MLNLSLALNAGLLPPVSGNPLVVTSPTITGMGTHGNVLTGHHGTYTNSPSSYTQQWYSANVAIPGATGTTYTVQLSDVGNNVTFVETAINGVGQNSAASLGTLITS